MKPMTNIPWSECMPKITGAPIFCELLRGLVHPGTFVVYGKRSFGRILNSKFENEMLQVVINVYTALESTKLRITRDTDSRTHGVVELVQTNEIAMISPRIIQDFAFVFSLESFLKDEVFGCQGMTNVFILRYRSDSELVAEFKTFPCNHPELYTTMNEDYSFRMFHDLKRLRRELGRLMGRYSMKQGSYCKNAGDIVASREFWNYLAYRVSSAVFEYEPDVKRRKIDRVLLPNFTLKSVRRHVALKQLDFDSAVELHQLTDLLGFTCLFEVRKRRAPLEQARPLNLNDHMNVIVALDGRQKPLLIEQCRQYRPGVKLKFDTVNSMQVQVRYELYQFRMTQDNQIKNCPSKMLEDLIMAFPRDRNPQASSDYDSSLTVDAEFIFEDEIFRVRRIDEQNERVMCTSLESDKERILTFTMVVPMIIDRLE